MSQGILRVIGMGTVFALVAVFFALMDTMGQLDVRTPEPRGHGAGTRPVEGYS